MKIIQIISTINFKTLPETFGFNVSFLARKKKIYVCNGYSPKIVFIKQ